ncbi:rubredoxin-type fold [Lucifera butyrica]|uniref:Rubredoxin-type fold n=1 Tax=Lucifera butyrica TaxID=1351585 RepID=A0A498R4B8_9FIRM|nr:hypothetical protein [Lucifera butyrica]VBB05013.1 rubredoxin-type fold [Lucifera butyrica]
MVKTYIRCKACGYIMDAAHLGEVCPACGLPKTVFEPYTRKISPRRKLILDQHLHPIMVHFPQVFIILIVVMPVMSLLVSEPWCSEFLIVTKLAILALPFVVFAGFLTGLVDGKLKFKKVTTPLLIKKIIVGLFFQVLSIAVFVLYLTHGFTGNTLWIIVGLSLASTGCAVYLGRVGSSMFETFLPG